MLRLKNNLLGIRRNDILKINSCEDFSKAMDTSAYMNREILIDNITPQIADTVDRYIRFWNDIDEEKEVLMQNREPIKILINSLGGALTAALTIMDSIKLSKTPVYTINIGTAYKEAFYIYLAGHKRYTYPRASFLLEKDLKQFVDESQSNNYISFCEKQNNELKDVILDKTKITEAEFNKHKNSWWLDADEAYKLKVCNEILRTHYY